MGGGYNGLRAGDRFFSAQGRHDVEGNAGHEHAVDGRHFAGGIGVHVQDGRKDVNALVDLLVGRTSHAQRVRARGDPHQFAGAAGDAEGTAIRIEKSVGLGVARSALRGGRYAGAVGNPQEGDNAGRLVLANLQATAGGFQQALERTRIRLSLGTGASAGVCV